jgi:hypothetical protein
VLGDALDRQPPRRDEDRSMTVGCVAHRAETASDGVSASTASRFGGGQASGTDEQGRRRAEPDPLDVDRSTKETFVPAAEHRYHGWTERRATHHAVRPQLDE